VQIQIKDRLLGPTWIPVFSPDGRRLAFRAERPSGMYAIGAIDFNNLMDPATGQVQVVWGPEFADLDQPRWSPDSSTLAYAGARQNAWTLVVGTEPRATHKDITGVTFRPDGVLAYMASDGAKYSIVVGDEAGPAFDTVTEPSFRSDGTLVYSASNEQRHFVVVGSEKHEVPKAAEGAAASADGTRVMWWYREGNPPSRRMVVNGVAGRYFARVSKPVLDAESGAFVYTAEDNKGYYVVTTRGVSAKFGGVLWNPRISEDGAKAGFVALIDNQLWWKVVPLR